MSDGGRRPYGPAFLWSCPATYAAHVVEEYVFGGGFPDWLRAEVGVDLSVGEFLAMNAVGLALTSLAAALAMRRRLNWLGLTVGVALLLNGLTHLVASLAAGSYSPGLVTGVAVWVPLGVAAIARGRRMRPRTFAAAGAAGLLVHAAVLLLVLAPSLAAGS